MRMLLFGLLMCVGATASAGGELDIEAKRFADQARTIRAELAAGDKYREISEEDRARVTSALERMGERIEAAGGVQSLPPQDMVEVFNDQESVNALLTKAREDSRMVCKRVKRTGSNFTSNYCRTVAEQRREAEGAREWLNKGQRSMAVGN